MGFFDSFRKFFKKKEQLPTLPSTSEVVEKPKEEEVKKPRDAFVLSIDGGGIKGIIPSSLLIALEEELKNNNKTLPIPSYFDLITGTSTGGLIALNLCKNEPLSPLEILNMYTQKNSAFFSSPRNFLQRFLKEKYSTEPMNELFNEVFKDQKFSDLKHNILVMSYDIKNSIPYYFSNTDTPELLLKDAAFATTAAPTYYKPYSISTDTGIHRLVDGGVIANNPILWAYARAKQICPDAPHINIISLGNFRKKPIFDDSSSSFSWLDFTKGTLPIYTLYHSAGMANASSLAKMFNDLNYIRIEYNGDSEENIKMDDNSPFTINRLSVISKHLVDENRLMFSELAKSLEKTDNIHEQRTESSEK